jgi:hypothetical protein
VSLSSIVSVLKQYLPSWKEGILCEERLFAAHFDHERSMSFTVAGCVEDLNLEITKRDDITIPQLPVKGAW